MVRAAIALLLLLLLVAAPAAHAAGFQYVATPDDQGRPIRMGIWYPSTAPTAAATLGEVAQAVAVDGAVNGAHLPVVIFSHGSAGWFGDRADSARALADAGFIAVSLTHPGDNFRDDTDRATDVLRRRPRQVVRVLDYILHDWPGSAHTDPSRIGFYGFSAGGFTGLVLLGGTPDFHLFAPHCADVPEEGMCQEGIARFLASPAAQAIPATAWAHDTRIRAAILASPGLAFSFDPASLHAIAAPVELWGGSEDKIVNYATNAAYLQTRLPNVTSLHEVQGARHYSFLHPCSATLRGRQPDICTDAPGFDRAAFQAELTADMIRFFTTTLTPPR